jgi:hypothetical protein
MSAPARNGRDHAEPMRRLGRAGYLSAARFAAAYR